MYATNVIMFEDNLSHKCNKTPDYKSQSN